MTSIKNPHPLANQLSTQQPVVWYTHCSCFFHCAACIHRQACVWTHAWHSLLLESAQPVMFNISNVGLLLLKTVRGYIDSEYLLLSLKDSSVNKQITECSRLAVLLLVVLLLELGSLPWFFYQTHRCVSNCTTANAILSMCQWNVCM